jgi:hypothetical protein
MNRAGDTGRCGGRAMKFKKEKTTFSCTKMIREDGKYTIESFFKKINNYGKVMFMVTDEFGNKIDELSRLKDAKEKYSN